MDMVFVPTWLRFWYFVNIVVLIPDWAFITLRPRSLEGGDLAFLFPLFIIYARVDKLFRDCGNKAVKYIYVLGSLDILACCYLFAFFKADQPWFALACICREVFVLTKTAFYLMYSYDFIVPSWRLPIYLMNSQWCFVPLIAIHRIGERLVVGLQGVDLVSQIGN